MILGSTPKICSQCTTTRPALSFPLRADGSYGTVCFACERLHRKPRPIVRDVLWADVIVLSETEIDRIVLLCAIEGKSAEQIQDTLRVANAHRLDGGRLVL